MDDETIFWLLSERVVAYRVDFAHCFGSIKAALFLSQIMYWTRKSQDGWVFRTREQITEDTGMSRKEQESGRRALSKCDILEVKRKGNPGRNYYRIKRKNLINAMREHYDSVGPKRTNKTDQTGPTRRTVSDLLSYKENKQRIGREGAPTDLEIEQLIKEAFKD